MSKGHDINFEDTSVLWKGGNYRESLMKETIKTKL